MDSNYIISALWLALAIFMFFTKGDNNWIMLAILCSTIWAASAK